MTHFRNYYFPPHEYVRKLSDRLKIRFASYINQLATETHNHISIEKEIASELGINIPMYGTYCNFELFFNSEEEANLLSALTLIFQVIAKDNRGKLLDFYAFINRCFKEEGAGYNMNYEGHVRYTPDEEFERNRISTLRGLDCKELEIVRFALDKAFSEFQTEPSKSKSALWHIFEANEILFKKITSPNYSFNQLNAGNVVQVKEYILSKVMLHNDQAARDAANKQLESFKDWVDSIHPYRHGQDVTTYSIPSEDFTIHILATGASFLRWLTSIHNTKISKK